MGKRLSQLNQVEQVNREDYLLVDGEEQRYRESKKVKLKDIRLEQFNTEGFYDKGQIDNMIPQTDEVFSPRSKNPQSGEAIAEELKNYYSAEEMDEKLQEFQGSGNGVGQTTPEGGEIFNDYENNKAISNYSTSIGQNNIAGSKIIHIDGIGGQFATFYCAIEDKSIRTFLRGLVDTTLNVMVVSDKIYQVTTGKYINEDTESDTFHLLINVPELHLFDLYNNGEDISKYLEGAFIILTDYPHIGEEDYGIDASSEGYDNKALAPFSHAEGRNTKSLNKQAHSEGRDTQALGNASHAEGNTTKAIGSGTHAEGFGSSADGYAAHVEGYYSKVFGDYAHSGGSHSVAGTQAFKIEEINFVPKEDEPEVPTGATATYYVSNTGVNTNDGLTANTPVLTIAKAVELANSKNYTAADIVEVFVLGTKVNIGTLPKYSYTLIVEGIGTGTKPIVSFYSDRSAANNTYASEEHGDDTSAKTIYKNVKLSIAPSTWSSIYLNGSNAIFEDTADFVREEYSTLVYGTQTDGGAAKSCDGQLVKVRGVTPYAINLSNASWARKTYTGDISLVIDNNSYGADVKLNSYQSSTPSGTTTYQANINLKIKAANSIKFSNEQGATVKGALQIINTDYDLNLTPYEGSLALINSPQWILKTYAGNDILDFTHTTGMFKVKEGYTVRAYHQTGRVFTSKDGFLDLSAYSGAYEFSAIESTKFEGTIKLSSIEGLTTAMKVSLKSNSDFILDAGEIVSINQSNKTIGVKGYPSQINRFTQGAFLFIRSNPELGDFKTGSSAFASGSYAYAIGNYAMAFGRHLIAAGDAQCVCGAFNLNKPDTVFELGCGTSDSQRANAFEVYKDGSIAVYDTKITRGDLSKLLDLLYQNRALQDTNE